MSLPIEFVASATALECYLACPRRFRYRYIDRAPRAGSGADVAGSMRRGDLFHKLVAWDALGLEVRTVLETEDDPELDAIWTAYQTHQTSILPAGWSIRHNLALTAHCGDVAVEARLDALVTSPDGGLTIYDWKTSPWPNRPKLARSPQTRVYPWVVWNSEPAGRTVDSITLVYWFPEEPDSPLELTCDRTAIVEADQWLAGVIDTISTDESFDMTSDRAMCRTCEYLAHCGVRPADGESLALDEDYFTVPDGDDESFDHWVQWSG